MTKKTLFKVGSNVIGPKCPLKVKSFGWILDDDDLSTDSEGLNLNTGSMTLLASDPIEKTFGVSSLFSHNFYSIF
jgi:hypothetical protein